MAYSDFYDEFASIYDLHKGRRTEHLVDLLTDIVELSGKRVLDIGVGTAVVWAQLHKRGVVPSHVTGIDISGGMLKKAQEWGLPFLETVQGTVDQLPSRPRFDMVSVMGLLRHYGDPQLLVGRAHTLLEPGGTLVVEDLSLADSNVRVGIAARRALADLMPGKVRSSFHAPDEDLRDMVELSGFSAVRWEPYQFETGFGSFDEILAYFLDETFLGWRIRGLPGERGEQAKGRFANALEEVLEKPVLQRRYFVASFERG